MKRFKTKQEFEREYGNNWMLYDSTNWVKSMHYLFGLQVKDDITKGYLSIYPELTTDGNKWNIGNWMLTDKPHPYEGKDIKISVTPEQSEIVQKRGEAMGYKFGGMQAWKNDDHQIVFRSDKKATWYSIGYCDGETYTELTFDQFCEGYWPEEETCQPEKEDAYLSHTASNYKWYVFKKKGNHYRLVKGLQDAHHYNILSENEYKKKYPLDKKLRFKGYEVSNKDAVWKIGCLVINKKDLQAIYNVLDKMAGENISADDAASFLEENKDFFNLIIH